MRPNFPWYNMTLTNLSNFRTGGAMYEVTKHISDGKNGRVFTVEHLETLLKSFNGEINQVMHTNNDQTVHYYFEMLKEAVDGWQLLNVDKDHFIKLADEYNEKVLKKFHEQVLVKEAAFLQEPNRTKYAHGEEYDTQNHFAVWQRHIPSMFKSTNYNIFCVEDKPELIDYALIDEYLKILTNITTQFYNAYYTELKLYEDGKVIKPDKEDTKFEKFIKWSQNNWIVLVFLVAGFLIRELAGFVKDVSDGKDGMKSLTNPDAIRKVDTLIIRDTIRVADTVYLSQPVLPDRRN